MKETVRNKLIEIAENKKLWNKNIEIDGETYIFVSSRNEFRKMVKQPSGEIGVVVAVWICNSLKEIV